MFCVLHTQNLFLNVTASSIFNLPDWNPLTVEFRIIINPICSQLRLFASFWSTAWNWSSDGNWSAVENWSTVGNWATVGNWSTVVSWSTVGILLGHVFSRIFFLNFLIVFVKYYTLLYDIKILANQMGLLLATLRGRIFEEGIWEKGGSFVTQKSLFL